MRLHIKTESVSYYILDDEAMTWKRVATGASSGSLRTDGGKLWVWPDVEVGKSMFLYGPPIDTRLDCRQVSTSIVTEIFSIGGNAALTESIDESYPLPEQPRYIHA